METELLDLERGEGGCQSNEQSHHTSTESENSLKHTHTHALPISSIKTHANLIPLMLLCTSCTSRSASPPPLSPSLLPRETYLPREKTCKPASGSIIHNPTRCAFPFPFPLPSSSLARLTRSRKGCISTITHRRQSACPQRDEM